MDDAVRKGIDVCEGAIEWRSKANDVEILHLYDEAVEFSGLSFVPAAVCESVYYVDSHDRHRFINVETYFSLMQEEKLAELQHIAFSLGASRYWVEMVEASTEKHTVNSKSTVKAKIASADVSYDNSSSSKTQSMCVAEAVFSGKRTPVEPNLSWFIHDRNVQNLIRMRCSDDYKDDITTYTIELNSSVSASMSTSTAAKIDAAVVKIGATCNFNAKSEEEHSRKMFFKLEF